jgi:hypothetical protein
VHDHCHIGVLRPDPERVLEQMWLTGQSLLTYADMRIVE